MMGDGLRAEAEALKKMVRYKHHGLHIMRTVLQDHHPRCNEAERGSVCRVYAAFKLVEAVWPQDVHQGSRSADLRTWFWS